MYLQVLVIILLVLQKARVVVCAVAEIITVKLGQCGSHADQLVGRT